MNLRMLPFALVFGAFAAASACSSKDSGGSGGGPTATPDTTPEGGVTADTGTTEPDTGTTTDGSVTPSGNPIDGIAAPTAIAALGSVAVIGPQWHVDGLYYAELKKDGHLIKLTPPATTTDIGGPVTAGNELLGTTFDEKLGVFTTCEVAASADGIVPARGGQIVRTAANATTGAVGTAIPLTADGGAPNFDAPKNVAVRRSDGTIYVTDPGYQVVPQTAILTNHIWRIKPTGETFETPEDGRPNGIAFSPDQKTLYVSFTNPSVGPPVVSKYPVGTDGALGARSAFATVAPMDSLADAVAVDSGGNVYVGMRTGIDVFKADGTKWGTIPSAKPVTGLAFGGADKRTLYIATDPVGLLEVTVNVAGDLD